MLDRLAGLETEYAIRFSPEDGVEHPGNRLIYEALTEGIRRQVATGEGSRAPLNQQFFVENGGAFCYEALPEAIDGGLVEGATPECRGPRQLLLYQKAQDELLFRAIASAEKVLEERGLGGSIGILKNCRDAEGNIYGAQENYEARFARGPGLWVWRVGLLALMPLAMVCVVSMWTVLAGLFVTILAFLAFEMVRAAWRRSSLEPSEILEKLPEPMLGRISHVLTVMIWMPLILPLGLMVRALAFLPMRTMGEAFLVSRSVLTGCGTVSEVGLFGLSEKGPAVRSVLRWGLSPKERPIFDSGNLMKPMMSLLKLDFSGVRMLMGQRQRLQIGLSDSNVAQAAEYLKVGTTGLVLDMCEAGFLGDAPRLKDPIKALAAISGDPSLEVRVGLSTGGEMSALELQSYYCERARQWVEAAAVPSLEALEVVSVWEASLEALSTDPASMVGRLDWVTKRYLLETCTEGSAVEVKRKLALRYHELGHGYLARLETAGAALVLVDAAEVDKAIHTPPGDSPARWRSQLMRDHGRAQDRVVVSWDAVSVGRSLKRKVIKLSDYR
jgi:proteasome accessory factor A